MKLKEKVEYLYGRHVKFHVEWGGNEFVTSASDMDSDIAEFLLNGIIKAKTEEDLEISIVRAVNRQMSREENNE